MDYIHMLRRALGVLLVFSWIALSGFDVTEDLDLPDPTELQSSTDSPAAGNGPIGLLVRNIVESANDTHSRWPNLLAQLATTKNLYTSHDSQKTSKLHKVHRVLLI